ncbi:hypothetical protein [Paenibacillus aceti]|uniref:Butirosin biosynthesis protein H N-terminal domain-containing protein n=1 Tax=Paenibacillus aceti TaxID=1820010 RepID=A0ABQ1W6V9_9BACL|nr:hypothetical protein [Paenibacillus aceti]GGG14426.1 hypothetical protein GCM10010913_40300 [Paenibacillus aceti]
MEYFRKLVPYNEFWMNCILNSAYSIATSVDPSYASAAYMNNYSYKSWGAFMDMEFITPTLEVLDYADDWDNFVLSRVIKGETPVFFEDPAQFLTELRGMISNQKWIKLNVDLFYWLPKNIAWDRFHMSHYAIVNGFDLQRKLYSALDDDIDGYGVHFIPEERVIQAFTNSWAMTEPDYELPHAYIFEIEEEPAPYQLDKSEVIDHAKRLAEELSAFSFDGLWNFKEEHKPEIDEYIRIALIGINIIENRHLGNELLFNKLIELQLIDEPLHQYVIKSTKKLKFGWKMIKQIFINKLVSEDKDIDAPLIRAKAQELLMIEQDMWSTVANEQ